jgi:hypothetical protein
VFQAAYQKPQKIDSGKFTKQHILLCQERRNGGAVVKHRQGAVMKHLLVSALLAAGALFLLPCTPTFAFDSSYRAKAMAFLAQDIGSLTGGFPWQPTI